MFDNSFEKSDTFYNTRNKDCVYVGKTKDFLIIINTQFAEVFFQNQSTELIQKYLDYFSKPHFVFAFEEYDSGGTYSYSLIYEGKVKRQFRSISYENTIDFGELEAVEVKWLNAETSTEDLGDGEFITLYKDPTRNFVCTKMGLPQVILQELMHEKLGFDTWNLDEFLIEGGHFEKLAQTYKPWWKLW